MNILAISASASQNSGNFYLLKAIKTLAKEKHEIDVFQGLYEFELFTPQQLKQGVPEKIKQLKRKIKQADAIILTTPEYTHNIPTVLKNLIEWCTHSGEFFQKKMLAITFTPHQPRGEHAMQSLLASLQALEAKVITQLPLYKTDVIMEDQKVILGEETEEILMTALSLLES